MTVLSRLLYGTMRVCAYDWIDEETAGSSSPTALKPDEETAGSSAIAALPLPLQLGDRREARLVASETLKAPEQGGRLALYPRSGE